MASVQVHSILFATSGTLLLVYTEREGQVSLLRRRLREGAPSDPLLLTSASLKADIC